MRSCAECGAEFYRRGMRRTQRFCSNSCAQKEKMRRPDLRANVEAVLLRAATSQATRPATRTEIMCPLNWRTCIDCGTEFLAPRRSGGAKRCGPCTEAWNRSAALDHYYRVRRPRDGFGQRQNTCSTCGSQFIGPGRSRRAYCSRTCALAIRRGLVVIEAFMPAEIYKRDGFRCGICLRPMAMSRAVPHPDAPTIDHILPVAEGGVHSRAKRSRCSLPMQLSA